MATDRKHLMFTLVDYFENVCSYDITMTKDTSNSDRTIIMLNDLIER